MATTINSGYANSPKLTANIADHADVYGGRALVFDGVTDYLDCGTGLGDQLGDNYSGGISVSMWINVNSSTSITEKGLFFIGDFGGSYGEFTITQNTNNLMIYLNQNAYQKTFAYTARDTWTHICFVADSQSESNTKFYIDGEAQSILTNVNNTFPSSGDLDFSGLKTVIGNFFNGNYPFHGKITDTKVFNSALTEAQVQELYKKPENTPSAVQDNLVAWYPMIEGNPESPQSIVYDHSEKKLGSELVTSNTTDNWTVLGSGTSKSNITNGVTLTAGTDVRNHFYEVSGTSSGKLYKFNVDAFIDDASDTNAKINVYDGSASNLLDALTTTSQNFTFYFIHNGTPYIQFDGFDNGTTINIQNMSIKEVLKGNHATTNFFGDELVTNGTMEANSNWGNASTAPASQGQSNEQAHSGTYSWKFTTDGSTSTGGIKNTTGFTTITGRTYKLNYWIYNVGANSHNLTIIEGDGSGAISGYNNNWMNSGQTNGQWNEITIYYVESSGGSSGFIEIDAPSTSNTWYIDDVSLKEVGVSSSGFETAVNEPVVPQVPLMRYNEKIFFNGNDGSGTEVLWENIGGAFASSKFTLSVVNLSRNQDEIFTIFDITESPYTDYLRLYRNSSGRYYLYIENSNDTKTIYQYGSYGNDAKHNHIVFTCDGSKWCFYINGYKVREDSFTHTTAHLASAHTDMRVGMLGHSGEAYRAVGIIDELSLWNTALTYDEVRELYADSVVKDATTHSKSSALRGYWRNDGKDTWKNRADNFASFDGVDDVITRDAINVDYKSISFWVRPNTTLTSASTAQSVMFFGAWAYGGVVFGNATSAFTNELISLNDYVGNHNKTVWIPTGGETIPNDSWTHVAFVWDGSKYIIYYNGQPQTVEGLGTGHQPLSTNKAIRIGTGGVSNTDFYGGDIANVAFWSESLTDAQMLSVYNSGHNGNISSIQSSDLELYYTFNPHALTDADTNASVQDRSGNNRDSTSVSGAIIETDGDVQGTPKTITIREGLNSNRDGLGFYFTNPSSNVLRLNGVDEYLQIQDSNVFSFGDETGDLPFSIEAWIKPTDATNFNILSKGKYNVDGEYLFQIDANDKLYFSVSDGAGYEGVYFNTALTSYEGSWLHVCATYDGRGGTDARNGMKLYIDTEQKTVTTLGGNSYVAMHNKTGEVEIGKYDTDYANGIIDELRVYNKELSLAEIQKNYKHQKGKHKND